MTFRKLPRILIDLAKLDHNYRTLRQRCRVAGVALTVVVKGLAGELRTVDCLVAAGLKRLGDSRLENLTNYQGYPGLEKQLLRLPTPETAALTVELTDLSLNAESATLVALDAGAAGRHRRHQVMLMVDLGDLREGVFPDELPKLAKECQKLRHLTVVGLGTNFSCFAGAAPTPEALRQLVEWAERLRTEFGLPIQWVSGGNSSSLPLLYNQNLPPGINHLRIGEAILLGRETLRGTILPDLYPDIFTVEVEVLQVQTKPTKPWGLLGGDAFGRTPIFPDIQPGLRLLLGLGEQDAALTGLTPLEPGLKVLGGSGDYLVVASERRLRVGQTVRFTPNYWSLLGLMSSRYVIKEYREF
jgi:predicted amino acid racemase